MLTRPLAVALVALASGGAALANDVQFHVCAAGQNLGEAYARTQYFNGEIGPDQSADVALDLANAAAHIAAAEAGVQPPFSTSPERIRSVSELQGQLAAYARNAEGRSPAARMSMIQGFYTHYLNALAITYVSSRPDAFRWTSTCDSAMLEANWHLGRAATYAAVRFDRGRVEETQARSNQGGANGSAFQAIRKGLSLAMDGVSPPPLVACFFNTESAWSLVPMLRSDEPHRTYVDLLPRVLEVCRSAGPHDAPRHHVTVPAVVGLALSDAKRRLAEAGLTVQLGPGAPAASPAASGTVEAQSVAAGTQVAAGSPVRLTVHSPYVAPQVPADSRVLTSEGLPPAGLPDLACPAEVTLAQPRDTLPAGTRIPLLSSLSGWDGGDPGSPYRHFKCWYQLGTFRNPLVMLSYTRRGLAPGIPYCPQQDSTSLLGTRYLFSRRAVVSAQAFNALNLDLAVGVAQDFVRRVEPYAEPCPGQGGPPPAPAPTPIPAVGAPPPSPPACPGPGVTVVYDLWNPPPYGGLGGMVCRDSSGGQWVNIANNVYPVTAVQTGTRDPSSGCWTGSRVVTPHHTYEGILCRK